MTDTVRPTKQCLDSIAVPVPNLGTRLNDVDHPLVVKAQNVPAEVRSGGADRIRALTDRTWFKVKTAQWRGAVAELDADLPAEALQLEQKWWLAAGGTRQADSSQRDFYAQLSDAAHRGGPHSCSTDHLLPAVWDINRLVAEAAVNAQLVLERIVRRAAAESLMNADIRCFVFGDRDVRVRVKVHHDGQVYVAIGATGSVDAKLFMTLVSALPGVPPGDWLPEPEGGLGIDPAVGEVVWSAMLSPAAQEQLLAFGEAQSG